MIFLQMKEEVTPIVKKILSHPFNIELANGSLPKSTFINYLVQDSLYLKDFSKTLALISTRLPSSLSANMLSLAIGAIEAEQDLHERFLHRHQVDVYQNDKNPACFMYTNYLLTTASLGSVEESVASVLPCFWIYQIVGEDIANKAQKSNPYHEWINMYSGKEFATTVQMMINLTNNLALEASGSVKTRMQQAFKRASELEWKFWHDAYHNNTWMQDL